MNSTSFDRVDSPHLTPQYIFPPRKFSEKLQFLPPHYIFPLEKFSENIPGRSLVGMGFQVKYFSFISSEPGQGTSPLSQQANIRRGGKFGSLEPRLLISQGRHGCLFALPITLKKSPAMAEAPPNDSLEYFYNRRAMGRVQEPR